MSHNILQPNRRILLVDDNPAIHDDFHRVLLHDDSELRELDSEAAALFGNEVDAEPIEAVKFELDSAHQGEEALAKVKEACEAGNPYAMAFVDMRMPPGWDGLRTIEEIWKVDSAIQIVICTAYSDRSWAEIQKTLTDRDRWLVVKKPFDKIEVLQLAHALTNKWDVTKAADLRRGALEQMVKARTEQLSAALQTNADFLNHASHEMLTPMNGVLGFLDLLSESKLNEEQSEFVDTASESANQLLRLLQQVLAFNDAGTDEVEPLTSSVVLSKWLPDIVSGPLRQKASEKDLELAIDIDPRYDSVVQLPMNIVEKVLGILLENAVKFTQSGSIKVSVSPCEDNISDLRFVVSDTGMGLTSEQIELVNIPFAQVDGSLARVNDGIGIGLPLARRLLALIGSNLDFESLPSEGTRVSFDVAAIVRKMAI
jgi:signal transduction histidine kinase